MKVVEINDSNIDEMIKSADKVVVDCYADWCGPCKMLSPIIDELAEEMDNVSFFKLNVDDNEDTSIKYDIMSIPTVLIFEKGELVQTSLGLRSKDELKEMI